MRHSFALFQSHLDLAHHYWSQMLQIGDTVIDATCGNGYDTLKLCQLTLLLTQGRVYAYDIQLQAIQNTYDFLNQHLPSEFKNRVKFHQSCHSIFSADLLPETIKLIVYNLGYLPKGNKAQMTQTQTTLKSLSHAQKLLKPGGVITITCYPGHPEGAKEQEALIAYTEKLLPQEWSCWHHRCLNRQQAPSLLLIQKSQEFFKC